VVRGRRLTAWVLARPILICFNCVENRSIPHRTVLCSSFILPPPVLQRKCRVVSFLGKYKTECTTEKEYLLCKARVRQHLAIRVSILLSYRSVNLIYESSVLSFCCVPNVAVCVLCLEAVRKVILFLIHIYKSFRGPT
jgi:hypothetical protein